MDRYLWQCADDAFKILADDGEWSTRLLDAKSRLFTTDHVFENVPQSITDAVAEVKGAENNPELSTALRHAINAILAEFALQEKRAD